MMRVVLMPRDIDDAGPIPVTTPGAVRVLGIVREVVQRATA